MFTIITSNYYSQKKLHSKKMKLDYVNCGDVKYCIVRLKKSNKVNWAMLENLLGETKERVIHTNEILIPKTSTIKLVDNTLYSHLITLKALYEIFSFNQKQIKNKTVTLVDVNCRYQNYADILVQFFGVVRIISKKVRLYEDYKKAMYYECGATIQVSDKMFPITNDNVLFISPDGIILSNMINQSVPIIIPKELELDIQSSVYHSFRAETSKEYLEAIPHELIKIDSLEKDSVEKENPQRFFHNFQSAVYQYCGLRTNSNLGPKYGYINNNKIMMDEIKNNIFTIDIN